MKKLDLSPIVSGAAMPLKKGSLQLIQDSYKEVVNALMNGLINYTNGDVIIIYGCVITGTNPGVISNTSGAIYYNGEIYLVDANTFNTTGANIPGWTIDSQPTSPADEAAFFDGTTKNIHFSTRFKLANSPIGGSGVAGYIADYNGATVKPLVTDWVLNDNAATVIDELVGGAPDTISDVSIQAKKVGNIVFMSGFFRITKNTAAVGGVSTNAKITPVIPIKADGVNNRYLGITTLMDDTSETTIATGYVKKIAGQSFFRTVAITGDTSTVGGIYKVAFTAQYETNL